MTSWPHFTNQHRPAVPTLCMYIALPHFEGGMCAMHTSISHHTSHHLTLTTFEIFDCNIPIEYVPPGTCLPKYFTYRGLLSSLPSLLPHTHDIHCHVLCARNASVCPACTLGSSTHSCRDSTFWVAPKPTCSTKCVTPLSESKSTVLQQHNVHFTHHALTHHS